MEGTQLFVTDVDLTALVEDDRFYYVLRSVPTFLKATNPFKLLVSIINVCVLVIGDDKPRIAKQVFLPL